jgi:hypothetical protein
MFDLPAALSRIEAIIAASDASLSLAERRCLKAESKQLLRDIDSFVEGPFGGDENALEKTCSIEVNIAQALGLFSEGGSDSAQHRGWARSDFQTLKSQLAGAL